MAAFFAFFGICPPPGVLPVFGPCERYMTPTLDAALLISSRAGTDPGLSSDSGVIFNPVYDVTTQCFSRWSKFKKSKVILLGHKAGTVAEWVRASVLLILSEWSQVRTCLGRMAN